MEKIHLKVGLTCLIAVSILVLNSPVVAQSPTQTKGEEKKEIRQEIKATIIQRPTIAAKIKGTRAVILGGKIESINRTILTVIKDNITYTVNTDNRTVIRRKFFGAAKLTEMQTGDIVNIHGKWADETQKTILATLVRDLSIQKRNGVFFGTVDSVSSNNIIISTQERGKETVTTSGTTRLVNRKMQRITLTDITPGQRIRVKGLWDSANNTITQVTQIKDFSLPVVVVPTGKK